MSSKSQTNNKRIAKNTLLLYVRMLFLMLISLYTSRVILATLGVTDYGIYNVVGGFVSMFSILRSGLTSATQRFITFDLGKGNIVELRKTFSTTVIIYCIISFIIFVVAECIGTWFLSNKLNIPADRMYAAFWVFQISLLTLIINLISTPYNALIIAHEKMVAFAYMSIYEGLAKLFISFAIYYACFDKLILFSVLLCLVQLSVRFIYGIYCKKYFPESIILLLWEWQKIKKIYSFTGWAMFGGIAHIGFTQGVNVLLNMFFNPTVNAARAIAVQIQHVVNNFVNNFQVAVTPQIIKLYAQGEKSQVYKLIYASSKYSYFLLLLLSLPVILESDQILSLWLVEVPEYTTVFFRLIIVTTAIDCISNPIMRAVDATGTIRNYQIIVGGILLLIVPVSYIVLKLGYPPFSVFIVHIALGCLAFCARLYMARHLIGISIWYYFKLVIMRCFFVTTSSALIPLLLFNYCNVSFTRLILIVIFSLICVCISVYTIGLEKEERLFLQNKIRGVIKYKIQKR